MDGKRHGCRPESFPRHVAQQPFLIDVAEPALAQLLADLPMRHSAQRPIAHDCQESTRRFAVAIDQHLLGDDAVVEVEAGARRQREDARALPIAHRQQKWDRGRNEQDTRSSDQSSRREAVFDGVDQREGNRQRRERNDAGQRRDRDTRRGAEIPPPCGGRRIGWPRREASHNAPAIPNSVTFSDMTVCGRNNVGATLPATRKPRLARSAGTIARVMRWSAKTVKTMHTCCAPANANPVTPEAIAPHAATKRTYPAGNEVGWLSGTNPSA